MIDELAAALRWVIKTVDKSYCRPQLRGVMAVVKPALTAGRDEKSLQMDL